MKTSITLTALFLLATTGLFAATTTKTDVSAKADVVTISSLPSQKGIDVKVEQNARGKAEVTIFDQDKNVIRKDVMTTEKGLEKAYNFSQLDNGNYTIEVTSGKKVVTENIHVYDEGQQKTFIITK